MTNTDLELIMAAAKNRTSITLFGVTFTPDPKPRSLRDEAIEAAKVAHRLPGDCATNITDAVIAVVADWLTAQPMQPHNLADAQRDHDVRLLRGGDDA